jgi:hypothetical protein
MFDEWLKRPYRGALGDERLQRVAMLEQKLERQCSVGGVICRMTGSKGFAVVGEGPRSDGEQNQERVFTSGIDERACVECEAHRDGVSCEPLL